MNTFGANSTPCAPQYDTATSVSERKTFPLLQQTARASFCSSLATVVPLPVPLSPWRTRTQPFLGASPSAATISLATVSADFPATSILVTGSTGGFAGSTPRCTAMAMPAASFSPSSASRARICSISLFASVANAASSANSLMIAFDVLSSPRSSSALLRPPSEASSSTPYSP